MTAAYRPNPRPHSVLVTDPDDGAVLLYEHHATRTAAECAWLRWLAAGPARALLAAADPAAGVGPLAAALAAETGYRTEFRP